MGDFFGLSKQLKKLTVANLNMPTFLIT